MLENKKLNMIISLLIAIGLWAFVIGEVNPEATRSYRDVPINFLNQEVLTSQNMAVYSVSQKTINVTLNGTRSEINKIDTKDIVATVDLSDAALGDNFLRVDLKVPSKVEIESQSINKVTVNVERREGKEIPIIVSYEGTFNGEEEPITVAQSFDTVIVYGAETTVAQVAAAKAAVAENAVTAEPQELQAALTAVNSMGQRIYNVSLSKDEVTITSELAKLKRVPLYVPIEGETSGGIERTVTTPEEIILKGKTADLDAIESITAETIYLDDVIASTVIPVTPVLPEGVELSAENGTLEAVIQVTQTETKSLAFDQTKIEIRGLAEGMQAQAADTAIEAVVTGSESQLGSLTEDDITIFADLTGLKEGRQKVILQAVCSIDGTAVTVSPKKVTVTIKVDAASGDADQPDDSGNENNDNNHESEE